MGLNISLYRVADMRMHRFEEDHRFDFIRYAGDEDFRTFMLGEGTALSCPHTFCCDWIFERPTDFARTRSWMREHIPEGNQKRLLDVLDWMESDTDLWLYFGY